MINSQDSNRTLTGNIHICHSLIGIGGKVNTITLGGIILQMLTVMELDISVLLINMYRMLEPVRLVVRWDILETIILDVMILEICGRVEQILKKHLAIKTLMVEFIDLKISLHLLQLQVVFSRQDLLVHCLIASHQIKPDLVAINANLLRLISNPQLITILSLDGEDLQIISSDLNKDAFQTALKNQETMLIRQTNCKSGSEQAFRSGDLTMDQQAISIRLRTFLTAFVLRDTHLTLTITVFPARVFILTVPAAQTFRLVQPAALI